MQVPREKEGNRQTPHLRKNTAVGVSSVPSILHWNWGDPEVKDWDFDTLEQQPQTMINADQCPYGCPLHCVHWMVRGGDKPLAGRGELSGIKFGRCRGLGCCVASHLPSRIALFVVITWV